jgi:hypothetical protein
VGDSDTFLIIFWMTIEVYKILYLFEVEKFCLMLLVESL